MPTATDTQLSTLGNWTFRLRPAEGTPARLLLLLHGWTGDEDSMWVLTQKLSPHYFLLAPRAPFPVPEGGYSWREMLPGTWGQMSLEELRPTLDALLAFIDEWSVAAQVEAQQFDLMGFSQGACLSYALAALNPARVGKMAALSGFLPDGVEELLAARPHEAARLAGKPVFVAHGRQDDMISVERARRAVAVLKETGAQVDYCESEGGHKVSKECLKGMEKFFGEI